MNYFVFAVCGATEYIEQLNFSLRYLKHFSKYPIIVATDTSRNEIQINHDNIIDVKTPKHLSNHQAHLYIETKLPEHLNLKEKDTCCYLDTDVIALSDEINNVFNNYCAPVTFSKDHCTIDVFSPKIMHCGCMEEFGERAELYFEIINMLPKIDTGNKDIYNNSQELKANFKNLKTSPFRNFNKIIKYLFKRYISKNTEFNFSGFTFNRKNHCWHDSEDNIILFDFGYYNKKIRKKTGVRFNGNYWVDKKNQLIQPELHFCNHLSDYLNETYNISIPQNFRHWNGGVFLFSKESEEFMNYWHKITLEESFKGKIQYYDDQATLVASAFKFETANSSSLPLMFNFIADYNSKRTKWSSELGYTYNDFKTTFTPAFIHIYHNWGDEKWDIWQSVIHLGKNLDIIK